MKSAQKSLKKIKELKKKHKKIQKILLWILVLGIIYLAFVSGYLVGHEAGQVARQKSIEQNLASQKEKLKTTADKSKQTAAQNNFAPPTTTEPSNSNSDNNGLGSIDLNPSRNNSDASCDTVAKNEAKAKYDNDMYSESTTHKINMNKINKMPDGSTDKTDARNREMSRHEYAISVIDSAYNSALINANCF